MIQFFVNLSQALSLPKSLGEIFGVLFCAEEPLCFDDVIAKTGISKGSASQGLRTLQKINAVKTVYVARDRRTFYEPELGMRRLLGGFLRETVEPHLRSGADHLEQISANVAAIPDPNPQEELVAARVESLRTWNRKAASILPWLIRFAGNKEEEPPTKG